MVKKDNHARRKHINRHIKLHKALDELVADFIMHNKDVSLTKTSLLAFMMWSNKQTQNPTEVK